MFLLKDLPTRQAFERFEAAYGEIDIQSVSLFLSVLRAGSDLLLALDKFLAGFGLSHGRWITLVLLMREENLSARPKTLAEKQGVTPATMTGLLQGLEKDRLISRHATEQDGRGSLVRLTPKGQALLQRIMPVYYASIARLTHGLSDEQKATALLVMNHLMQSSHALSQLAVSES